MCGMAYTSGDAASHLQKLAVLIRQRRVALGFTSKEKAAAACGISHMTYRKIEGTKGVPPQRADAVTYAKVEVGFQIRAGQCERILDGQADSLLLEDGTELVEGGQIRDFVDQDRLEEEVDRAFDRSAQLTAPHLTLSEARALKEELIRELRTRGVLKSP
jgi:transcriptional regulator with XRE-family HTH domain